MITRISPANVWKHPDRFILPASEVHIWRATLDQLRLQIDDFYAVLDIEERERASRYHFQKDSEHFILSRGLLRKILGHYLSSDPKELHFSYNPYGKPFLKENFCGNLRFNLSHSQGLLLLAVNRGRELGIDVEQMRPEVIAESIAERFFSPYEVATLRSLPVRQQVEAFFNCWTRKEAYIKARGEGLSCPLHMFDVSLKPGEPAALLATRIPLEETTRWRVEELTPGINFKAALVAEQSDWQLQCWQWPQ
jgi:4'-phosphopantetheinyl transferase